MTRMLLIHAGPTPWDVENRLTGSHSLPLTRDALAAVQALVDAIPTPTAIYLCEANEACLEAGRVLSAKFGIRIRDTDALEEMRLGLWEGLTREEVRRRFPTVIPQWQEDPLSVLPPEGETLGQVIERVEPALRKIRKRNHDGVVALVLRPLVMQVVLGLLRREAPQTIATHLNNVDVMETMDVE